MFAPQLGAVPQPFAKAGLLDKRLPLYFEQNIGQVSDQIKFIVRHAGGLMLLTPQQLRLLGAAGHALSIRFHGAKRDVIVEGIDPLPGRTHYLRGQEPQTWVLGARHFRAVRYSGIYRGIDAIVYFDTKGQLGLDFIVAPGASPQLIHLSFGGAQKVDLAPDGRVWVKGADTELWLSKPFLYQTSKGVRSEVPGGFRLLGKNELKLTVGPYDSSQQLIIDPIINYSTLLVLLGHKKNILW
jgi:hypothetical protein